MTTSDYTDDARARLGAAVADARTMAGFKSRSDLAREADISLRSLDKVELGQPGVGRRVLLSIARVLPGWDADTPKAILEGTEPPTPESPEPPKVDTTRDYTGSFSNLPVGSDEWLTYWSERLDAERFKEVVRIGLQVRAKRRELEMLAEVLDDLLTDGPVPHDVGEPAT